MINTDKNAPTINVNNGVKNVFNMVGITLSIARSK